MPEKRLWGGTYNLVTTLACLDVTDFTHFVEERRALRMGQAAEKEGRRQFEKRGFGSSAVCGLHTKIPAASGVHTKIEQRT